MFKKETGKILYIQISYNRNTADVKCENKNGTSNNSCNWNHLSPSDNT